MGGKGSNQSRRNREAWNPWKRQAIQRILEIPPTTMAVAHISLMARPTQVAEVKAAKKPSTIDDQK
tara:strand:+ start:11456 stop:11653 length:198 start_codon:yes stop_codon:yes gene_type:complete